MTRDLLLVSQIDKADDLVTDLIVRLTDAKIDARKQGAEGHAEHYENVISYLRCAEGDLYAAMNLMIDGDEKKGVPPLEGGKKKP